MKGYVGKILRIDLTNRKISTIDTEKYEQWGGGHGIGTALFWDLCKDKTVSAYDPGNVVTVMTSPLSGTLTPSASGRTEVQGIGPQAWPHEWFTRSNFGGRFGAMLKYAGWDGIVIEGKADVPVWVDIRNREVQIKDAKGLWGLDTRETQEEIWSEFNHNKAYGNWHELDTSRDTGRSTQKPAILAIGQAGEHLSRIASLIHDAGNGAGQGGFGGVWGSKNLKAISVFGTGSIEVADPNALMQARVWLKKGYAYDVDDPKHPTPEQNWPQYGIINKAPGQGPTRLKHTEPSRPQGCMSCFMSCRWRNASGHANESSCVESIYSIFPDKPDDTFKATDLLQTYGINAYGVDQHGWLRDLYKMGVLGRGKQINSELPFEKYGTLEFIQALLHAIAYREDIGADLAEGFPRAAEKWGRLGDMETGLMKFPNWGYSQHYDPRVEVEWGYGSLMGDRDINEHCLCWIAHWMPQLRYQGKLEPLVSAEELAKQISSKFVIFDDPMMLDYSKEGVYSDAKVKMIAWHRYYTRFYKQSLLYCDWAWPNFLNPNHPENDGFTPEGEPKFFNAVTGSKITFEEGLKIGQKIWNIDRAIWVIQGRHRDQEKFTGYVYKVPTNAPYYEPVYEDGKWSYSNTMGRTLDPDKFEDWKTRFYKFEGWDPKTGWPKKSTLKELGLDFVADELGKQGKLGEE